MTCSRDARNGDHRKRSDNDEETTNHGGSPCFRGGFTLPAPRGSVNERTIGQLIAGAASPVHERIPSTRSRVGIPVVGPLSRLRKPLSGELWRRLVKQRPRPRADPRQSHLSST